MTDSKWPNGTVYPTSCGEMLSRQDIIQNLETKHKVDRSKGSLHKGSLVVDEKYFKPSNHRMNFYVKPCLLKYENIDFLFMGIRHYPWKCFWFWVYMFGDENEVKNFKAVIALKSGDKVI